MRSAAGKIESPKNAKLCFFTLIELLVVVSVIAALTSLLLPALSSARSKGKQMLCSGNLRQVGVAANVYAGDFNGFLPPLFGGPSYGTPYPHQAFVQAGVCSERVFRCPEMPPVTYFKSGVSYGVNACLSPADAGSAYQLSQSKAPSLKLFYLDCYQDSSDGLSNLNSGWWRVYFSSYAPSSDLNWGRPAGRHLKRCQILWLDGHCGGVSVANIHNPYLEPLFNYNNASARVDSILW